ncbi:MAG: hypothetical protein NTU51_04430 [Bacteroidetes bacterium]|nr:hypothetical protein [Bacteroidota bacterium]
MKNFLFPLLLWACFSAFSQPWKPPRHVILIRNNHKEKLSQLTENYSISVIIKSGKLISGKVKLIRADTVFFPDTILLASEIDSLFSHSIKDIPRPFPKRQIPPNYVAGSPDWQLIFPPDSVYRDHRSYGLYFKSCLRQARSDWREKKNPLVFRNFLKFNVSKLAHLEIAFSYERVISKDFTWETELSTIFGIPGADAYYMINYPLYNYSGFSVTTNPKYYVINPSTYIGLVFMYRYLWAENLRTNWPEGGSNGDLQDQYRNDFGLSLRIGVMKRYKFFIVDYYLGGGVKLIQLHQLLYGYYLYHDSNAMQWYNPDHSPNINNLSLFGPVINLGIKIGFGF